MNVELERTWKEMVVAYFGHYSSFRLEGKDCLERLMFLLCYTHRICIPQSATPTESRQFYTKPEIV